LEIRIGNRTFLNFFSGGSFAENLFEFPLQRLRRPRRRRRFLSFKLVTDPLKITTIMVRGIATEA
jgi:hypothetical protein